MIDFTIASTVEAETLLRIERIVVHQTDLMKTGVLDMVGSHLLLSLDLHTDVKANSTRHCRLVRPFL